MAYPITFQDGTRVVLDTPRPPTAAEVEDVWRTIQADKTLQANAGSLTEPAGQPEIPTLAPEIGGKPTPEFAPESVLPAQDQGVGQGYGQGTPPGVTPSTVMGIKAPPGTEGVSQGMDRLGGVLSQLGIGAAKQLRAGDIPAPPGIPEQEWRQTWGVKLHPTPKTWEPGSQGEAFTQNIGRMIGAIIPGLLGAGAGKAAGDAIAAGLIKSIPKTTNALARGLMTLGARGAPRTLASMGGFAGFGQTPEAAAFGSVVGAVGLLDFAHPVLGWIARMAMITGADWLLRPEVFKPRDGWETANLVASLAFNALFAKGATGRLEAPRTGTTPTRAELKNALDRLGKIRNKQGLGAMVNTPEGAEAFKVVQAALGGEQANELVRGLAKKRAARIKPGAKKAVEPLETRSIEAPAEAKPPDVSRETPVEHVMPDGEVMPGRAHPGAVEGSERVAKPTPVRAKTMAAKDVNPAVLDEVIIKIENELKPLLDRMRDPHAKLLDINEGARAEKLNAWLKNIDKSMEIGRPLSPGILKEFPELIKTPTGAEPGSTRPSQRETLDWGALAGPGRDKYMRSLNADQLRQLVGEAKTAQAPDIAVEAQRLLENADPGGTRFMRTGEPIATTTGDFRPPNVNAGPSETFSPINRTSAVKELSKTLGVMVRQLGPTLYKNMGVRGLYDPSKREILSGGYMDDQVVAHEIAHDFVTNRIDLDFSLPRLSSFRTEIEKFVPEVRLPFMSGIDIEEGFAEWLRKLLTRPDMTETKDNAPQLYDHFMREMDKKQNRKTAQALFDFQDKIRMMVSNPAIDDLKSGIVSGKTVAKRQAARDKNYSKLDVAYTHLVNSDFPLENMTDRLQEAMKVSGQEISLMPGADPRILIPNMRGTEGAIRFFIHDGTFTPDGRIHTYKWSNDGSLQRHKTVSSWQEVLDLEEEGAFPVSLRKVWTAIDPGQHLDFLAGAMALRALTRWKPGQPWPLGKRWPRPTVEAALESAIKNVHGFGRLVLLHQQWKRDLLSYVVESGRITEKMAKLLNAADPYHISFRRVVDELLPAYSNAGGGGKGYVEAGQLFKKMNGSERDLLNPMESELEAAARLISSARKAEVTRAIAELAEQIPIPGARFMTPSQGETATTVPVWKKGENKPHVVHDDLLYKSLQSLSPEDLGWLTKGLAAPARVLRYGVIMDPEYIFLKNLPRDLVQSFIVSRYGMVKRPHYWFKGLLDAVFERPMFKDAERFGLRSSTFVGVGRAGTPKAARILEDMAAAKQIRALLKQYKNPLRVLDEFRRLIKTYEGMRNYDTRTAAWWGPRAKAMGDVLGPLVTSGFKGLRWATEMIELAPRMGEVEAAVKNLTAKGMSYESAMRVAVAAARDLTIDFAMAGLSMRQARILIAFLSGAINGLDKTVRTLAMPQSGKVFKQYTREEKSRFKQAMGKHFASVWVGMGMLAAIVTINDALNEMDPTYQNSSKTLKDGYLLIPVGKRIDGSTMFLKWRLSNEIGAIAKVVSLGVQAVRGKMSWRKFLRRSYSAILNQINLDFFAPSGTQAAIEAAMNRSWGMRRPIIDQGQAKLVPSEQTILQTAGLDQQISEILTDLGLPWAAGKLTYARRGIAGTLPDRLYRYLSDILHSWGAIKYPGEMQSPNWLERWGVIANPMRMDTEKVISFWQNYGLASQIHNTYRKIPRQRERFVQKYQLNREWETVTLEGNDRAVSWLIRNMKSANSTVAKLNKLRADIRSWKYDDKMSARDRWYKTLKARREYVSIVSRLDDIISAK